MILQACRKSRVILSAESWLSVPLFRTMSIDIGGMRKPYNDENTVFDLKDLVSREPFSQFKAWFEEASKQPLIEEANAMCLATSTKDGFPSARMVLLKKYGPEGFTFYTNYTSRKGEELDSNPRAALMFYWEPLKRSIRVEGKVARVDESESREYFQSRPVSSQIGAWVSDQSKVIPGRSVLTDKQKGLTDKYKEGPLPHPTHWGGYRVVPNSVEFWQGQSTRIHDRIRFRRRVENEVLDPSVSVEGEEGWIIERLAP